MNKYSVCNELFGQLSFADSCSLLHKHGFHGVEIAPFTLFDDPGRFDPKRIAEIRRILEDHGLEFTGLHWLFLKPEGLHITTPEQAVRRRSWNHLRRLVELAAELGGGVLVLGSPKQRGSLGIDREQATAYLEEGLRSIADFTAGRNCTILLEALSAEQTDVVNTLAEAERSIRRIAHPAIRGIFDFHNSADEPESWERLIEAHFPLFAHVHLNDVNGSWPGSAGSDFVPAFRVLGQRGYQGWISLEIFHVPQDPAQVLEETREFLDRVREVSR
jgi:D-psicose/D-tagatose/L-ribulose 3-epimerase